MTTQSSPSEPVGTVSASSSVAAVTVPIALARFSSHVSRHGLAYAVAWLIIDATGTWAAFTSAAAGVCG